MDADVLKGLSHEFLLLSAVHHVALFVMLAILWMRREALTRTSNVYFTIAFATAAFALATRPETRWSAVAAGALAALWLRNALRPRITMSFGRAPRLRLWIMGCLGLFGFAYPGYSGEFPSLFFAPLGVILPPTLLVALALMNSASPSTDRTVHWALAATALAVGGVGLVVEGWIHAPLVGAAAYAVALLLGAGRPAEAREGGRERSVREIRDRMYARRTILPGPRDPRRRRFQVRRRRR
jgi:hypothetical protein